MQMYAKLCKQCKQCKQLKCVKTCTRAKSKNTCTHDVNIQISDVSQGNHVTVFYVIRFWAVKCFNQRC